MSEDMELSEGEGSLLRLTAEIVAAYVSKNPLPAQQIPEVISTVYSSLAGLNSAPAVVAAEPPKPAVPIRKSVTPEYIVCLEDGKKLKMLKRHLRSTYNMTPDEYRVKWGLPADYPMVAPNYAAQRSDFAKKIGLGRTSGRLTRRRTS
jgi:predicted transcriptional regulator